MRLMENLTLTQALPFLGDLAAELVCRDMHAV